LKTIVRGDDKDKYVLSFRGGQVKTEQAFKHVLKRLRKSSGLSQESLAEECGIDRTYVSLLERGLRQPSLLMLIRLCRPLKVSLVELAAEIEKELRRTKP
jgi:transcriptional regulator with XRE-family HTH domain